jgi:ferredoxin
MGHDIVQKVERHRDRKLRDLARGQPCQVAAVDGHQLLMNREFFFHDPQTVVWAHSNMAEHGKGKSIKSHDCFGFLACAVCHVEIDQGRRMAQGHRRQLQRSAMMLTRVFLVRNLLVEGATLADAEFDDVWFQKWSRGEIKVAT